jgi:hypothetical protein
MRGQFGLRPSARQNGRLLTLFLPPFWRTLPHRRGPDSDWLICGGLLGIARSLGLLAPHGLALPQ